MVRFVLNQTIETAETTIAVDPGLSPGRHRFRLVVIDDAGKRSQPVEAIVEIKGEIVPPALPTDLPASPVRPAVDFIPQADHRRDGWFARRSSFRR